MKQFLGLLSLAYLLLFSGACASRPGEHEAIFSPNGSAWVRLETLPADTSQDRWVPTQRMILGERWTRSSLELLDGAETLCGIEARWLDDKDLLLRVPAPQASHVKVGSQAWHGIQIQVQLHEDQVKRQAYSEDRQRRLVVIAACESGEWNLYLRRAGEPTFNAAMEKGWDDPDVFGGFGIMQSPLDLRWTGPRSATIIVPGRRNAVTLREQIGDVHVHWTFLPDYVPEDPSFVPLERAK